MFMFMSHRNAIRYIGFASYYVTYLAQILITIDNFINVVNYS